MIDQWDEKAKQLVEDIIAFTDPYCVDDFRGKVTPLITAVLRDAVKREREQCTQLVWMQSCDRQEIEMRDNGDEHYCECGFEQAQNFIATAIRARGE